MSRPVQRDVYHPPAERRCGFCHGPMPGPDIYPEPVHPCCELDHRAIAAPALQRTLRRRRVAARRRQLTEINPPR